MKSPHDSSHLEVRSTPPRTTTTQLSTDFPKRLSAQALARPVLFTLVYLTSTYAVTPVTGTLLRKCQLLFQECAETASVSPQEAAFAFERPLARGKSRLKTARITFCGPLKQPNITLVDKHAHLPKSTFQERARLRDGRAF